VQAEQRGSAAFRSRRPTPSGAANKKGGAGHVARLAPHRSPRQQQQLLLLLLVAVVASHLPLTHSLALPFTPSPSSSFHLDLVLSFARIAPTDAEQGRPPPHHPRAALGAACRSRPPAPPAACPAAARAPPSSPPPRQRLDSRRCRSEVGPRALPTTPRVFSSSWRIVCGKAPVFRVLSCNCNDDSALFLLAMLCGVLLLFVCVCVRLPGVSERRLPGTGSLSSPLLSSSWFLDVSFITWVLLLFCHVNLFDVSLSLRFCSCFAVCESCCCSIP
jgi:hypothetical protein